MLMILYIIIILNIGRLNQLLFFGKISFLGVEDTAFPGFPSSSAADPLQLR